MASPVAALRSTAKQKWTAALPIKLAVLKTHQKGVGIAFSKPPLPFLMGFRLVKAKKIPPLFGWRDGCFF